MEAVCMQVAAVPTFFSCSKQNRLTSSPVVTCLSVPSGISRRTSTSFSQETGFLENHFIGQKLRLHSHGSGRACGRVQSVRAELPSVTESQFDSEVLKSELPVLVDFWAPWCGPCKLVVPALEALAKEYDGKMKIVKMDVDGNPEVVKNYKVYGLPFLILFRGGEVLFQHEGAIGKAKLKALIDDKLPASVPN